MKVTKDTLQLFCKALGVSAVGNKGDLSLRICGELCGKKTPVVSLNKAKTLKQVMRAGEKLQVKKMLQLVVDLYEEDLEMSSIVKQVKSKFNIRVDSKDINFFLDVLDASKKKDYTMLDDMKEDKKYDFAFKLVDVYA